MMGKALIVKTLRGQVADRPPILPMVHAGLAGLFDVPLGRFFQEPGAMADVMIEARDRFGFDGVQMSQGVTGEVEALGAKVEQPDDGSPILRQYLLADSMDPAGLRELDPAVGGRMPRFFEAIDRVVRSVGSETFVLATLRGPLLIASQLRGVETLLMDMVDRPAAVCDLLDFTTDVSLRTAEALLKAGPDGLLLGEAVCSPNFISPDMYRQMVVSRHRRLVCGLKAAGWRCVGLHICGNIVPIFEDIVSTGIDFFDIDYQVPASQAVELSRRRVALRGNLDPSALFRFGDPSTVAGETRRLCQVTSGMPWIMSSGCDIPPGSPAENIEAFVTSVQEHGRMT